MRAQLTAQYANQNISTKVILHSTHLLNACVHHRAELVATVKSNIMTSTAVLACNGHIKQLKNSIIFQFKVQ